MAHLTFISQSELKSVEVRAQNSIGRHPDNHIQIQDASVSKNHCHVSMDGSGRFFLEDRASTNGTFVNNRRVQGPTEIYPGDEIRVGNVVLLLASDVQEISQMVEIRDALEGFYSSTMLPQKEMRFLPEYSIFNEKDLRADYEKLRVTYELQYEINLERDIGKTLDRILARTFEFLEYDQGVILLADKKGNMIPHNYKTWRGSEKLSISSTLIRYVQEKRAGVISTDIPSDSRFNIAESIMLEGIQSTIAVPMLIDDEILGIMIIYSLQMKAAFTIKDLGLITAIANQTARIIKNAFLHEELRLSFDSSMRTLSATVDARHPLTAGHSARVTEISLLIARRMHLSENDIRVLKFASLMHDIGKIAVPDDVLLKHWRLTAEEKACMDIHPAKTREILDNFYFPDSFAQVPLIAGSHHEKMDGTGYPLGLKGEEIPLLSRIMAVADVFDALTVKRDYPKYIESKTMGDDPLPLAAVIKIINEGAGQRFDKKVVAAFLECLPEIIAEFKTLSTSSRPE